MEAHRFLEQIHDTHTVLEMRSKLRSTGAIGSLFFFSFLFSFFSFLFFFKKKKKQILI